MKIYTGTGDAARRACTAGARSGRTTARVEAYGTVDEANALLGVAATHLGPTRSCADRPAPAE
jgi:cob(I)alamin adenosyltransferase